MTLDPAQTASLRTSLRQARMIWFALCFGAPLLLYGFASGILPLGRAAFRVGFAAVPWRHPLVYGILILSGLTLVAAGILPEWLSRRWQPKDPSIFHRLRLRHLITCLFLLTVPLEGFLLDALLGPDVASLSLALMVVPVVAGCMLYPNEHDWRYRFELSQAH